MTTPGTIKVDTAALNNIAQQLEQLAAALTSSGSECDTINAQVETGAAEFIEDRQPDPIYNTVVSDVKAVGTGMKSEVENLIRELTQDAAACRQLAAAHVQDEQKNADTIGAIKGTLT
jgi:catabolite regulation protein CreA